MVKLANPYVNDIAVLNDFFPLSHMVWAALEKIGGKEKKPALLAAGAQHDVHLKLAGTVDGQSFEQSIHSIVSIGHAQQRASSVNPQVPELIAYILGKLNTATRNRILADIPTEFQENDHQLPDAGPVLVDEAKHLLQQLRQTKTVTARGAIRCQYTRSEAEPVFQGCPCQKLAGAKQGSSPKRKNI